MLRTGSARTIPGDGKGKRRYENVNFLIHLRALYSLTVRRERVRNLLSINRGGGLKMAGRKMRGHHANICRAVNFITVDHERSSPRICLVPRASTSFPLALFRPRQLFDSQGLFSPRTNSTRKREKQRGKNNFSRAEGTRVVDLCPVSDMQIWVYRCTWLPVLCHGSAGATALSRESKNLRRRLAYAYAWSVCATSQGVGNNCQLALSVGMRRFLREFRPLERLCPP